MNIRSHIALNIRMQRQRSNKTIKQASSFLGVSEATLYKYEEGKLAIPSERLYELSLFYNADTKSFFENIPAPKSEETLLVRKETLGLFRILIIEDDPSSLFILDQAIRSSGLATHTVVKSSSEDATQYLLQKGNVQNVDIFFVDLNLPGQSGIDFIRFLRRHNLYKLSPIIVITTDNTKKTLTHAMSVGATSYIIKSPIPENMDRNIHRTLSYWHETTVLPSRLR